MFDRQLMFDDAAKHMAQQRARCVEGGLCMYRGPGATRCLIGALIPDNLYNPAMDGKGAASAWAFHDVIRFLDPKYGTKSYNMADDVFARELQKLHDMAPRNLDWDRGLRRYLFDDFASFAKKFGLDFRLARRVLTRDDDVPASRTVPAFTEENHDSYAPTCSPGEFLDAQ
jgi:hypothetical protein